jgi:hypothetical protein
VEASWAMSWAMSCAQAAKYISPAGLRHPLLLETLPTLLTAQCSTGVTVSVRTKQTQLRLATQLQKTRRQ